MYDLGLCKLMNAIVELDWNGSTSIRICEFKMKISRSLSSYINTIETNEPLTVW